MSIVITGIVFPQVTYIKFCRRTSCENQLKQEKKALEQQVSDVQAATVAVQKSIEKVKLEATADTMKELVSYI